MKPTNRNFSEALAYLIPPNQTEEDSHKRLGKWYDSLIPGIIRNPQLVNYLENQEEALILTLLTGTQEDLIAFLRSGFTVGIAVGQLMGATDKIAPPIATEPPTPTEPPTEGYYVH